METKAAELITGNSVSCVRTIVVWKRFCAFNECDHIPRCVRTIVVWKRYRSTRHNVYLWCCVRTIVVWKRVVESNICKTISLRENHSGMETEYGWCERLVPDMLRENHSGMETEVLWLQAPHVNFGLRENHSGM